MCGPGATHTLNRGLAISQSGCVRTEAQGEKEGNGVERERSIVGEEERLGLLPHSRGSRIQS